MNVITVICALGLLMFVAYRGFSVILFAPLCAMLAVLLSSGGAISGVGGPSSIPPVFSAIFMEEMVGFLKRYFPVFMLGAVFGKVIELAGYSKSIVSALIGLIGDKRAMLSIVLVCAVLTYGGVSLFVVVFAVYPFAAEMFKQSEIPKRLIPGTIALGSFTFTMDSLPGSPQIQNIIPTSSFKTDAWAAPWMGVIGSVFILVLGLSYLEWRRMQAALKGEGYGAGHFNEPEPFAESHLPNPFLALVPLILVVVLNRVFTNAIRDYYGVQYKIDIPKHLLTVDINTMAAIWAVEGALLVGILAVVVSAYKRVVAKFAEGSKAAIGGSLLASLNTASEYGFGGVIASLPGFVVVSNGLKHIPNTLVNEATTVTALAAITGSASGGMSIALAAMSETFIQAANASHIPLQVMHRVASMASGGLDTLPHNGAVITLLAVTGLTHRVAYRDIFALTLIKTVAVFFVIAVYYLTGIY